MAANEVMEDGRELGVLVAALPFSRATGRSRANPMRVTRLHGPSCDRPWQSEATPGVATNPNHSFASDPWNAPWSSQLGPGPAWTAGVGWWWCSGSGWRGFSWFFCPPHRGNLSQDDELGGVPAGPRRRPTAHASCSTMTFNEPAVGVAAIAMASAAWPSGKRSVTSPRTSSRREKTHRAASRWRVKSDE